MDVIIFIGSYYKFEKAELKLKSLSMMSTYKIVTLTSTQNIVLKISIIPSAEADGEFDPKKFFYVITII
jgi:hypothetical protein